MLTKGVVLCTVKGYGDDVFGTKKAVDGNDHLHLHQIEQDSLNNY